MTGYDISLGAFRTLLSQPDTRPILAFLNGMSSHRFTAVFQFDGKTLRNVGIFDRESETVERLPPIEVGSSYCVFVRDGQKPFVVDDSAQDARVMGHSKQFEVQSYCGVPLRNEAGALVGTVCHFDPSPQEPDGRALESLEQASELLIRFASDHPDFQPAAR